MLLIRGLDVDGADMDAAVEIPEILLYASDSGVHFEIPPVAGRTLVCEPGRRRVRRLDEMGDAAEGWEL